MAFFNPFQRDNIVNGPPSRTSPSGKPIPVIPSDTTVYDPPLRAITADAGGNVSILSFDDYLAGSTTPVIISIGDTGMRPAYISKVLDAGTTATNIVGWR